jgi:predicted enzyme related to lactoylglutathione lyase
LLPEVAVLQLLVNVDVDDLPRATAFYVSAFELSIGRRFGDAGVELLGAASPIYLLAKSNGSEAALGAHAPRDYRRHWTPVHLDFVVDDLDQALKRAIEAGATLESPKADNAWGRIAMLSDPFGHGFCLVQFVGRGYDAIATDP